MHRKISPLAPVGYPLLAVKTSLCANELTRMTYRMLKAEMRFQFLFSAAILALSGASAMSQTDRLASDSAEEVVAAPLKHEIQLDAAHPSLEWQRSAPVSFCGDWQGKNADPAKQTEVRVMWSSSTLYIRFVSHYRDLNVFSDSDPNGRRDYLWDRDVAEAFLQPDPSKPRFYKEFEVAPNGMWIDLDISPGPLADLKSGLQRSVWLEETNHIWAAELAIPMRALTRRFDPTSVWRVNFYRIEGKREPRSYLAWRPTNTSQPNFHVPDAFGKLRFAESAMK